jgi:hypothetical protein
MRDHVVGWLSDSDPALRWQVERDLAGESEEVWAATRASVATTGFGARLLGLQEADGQWAGGAYFPAPDRRGTGGPSDGQPWTATTWSLNALREWGVDAAVLQGTAEKLATNSRWEYDGAPYWSGEVDCCINAFALSNGLWLGADVDGLVDWFLQHRMADGGWNCAWVDGSTRSSFHSTLNALWALLDQQRATGQAARVADARRSGEEYLLVRGLHRRRSTGETVAPWAVHFGYPFRWAYSVLRALDYFRAASLLDGTPPDRRLEDAVGIVRAARRDDGTWLQGGTLPGAVWFPVDAPKGEPSRWLTFVATRVLDWWDASA